MKIGPNIERARSLKGMSQAQLSRAIGLQQSRVSRWEKDDGMPSAEQIYAIAKATGSTVEFLMTGQREAKDDQFSEDERLFIRLIRVGQFPTDRVIRSILETSKFTIDIDELKRDVGAIRGDFEKFARRLNQETTIPPDDIEFATPAAVRRDAEARGGWFVVEEENLDRVIASSADGMARLRAETDLFKSRDRDEVEEGILRDGWKMICEEAVRDYNDFTGRFSRLYKDGEQVKEVDKLRIKHKLEFLAGICAEIRNQSRVIHPSAEVPKKTQKKTRS